MTTTVISSNSVFPHLIENQEVDFEILHAELEVHEVSINKKLYFFEISKTRFINKSEILIEGFLFDDLNLGRMAFHINHSKNTA